MDENNPHPLAERYITAVEDIAAALHRIANELAYPREQKEREKKESDAYRLAKGR